MRWMGFAMAVVFASTAGTPLAQQPASSGAPAHSTFVLAGCLQAPLPGASLFRLADPVSVGHAPPSRPAPPPETGAGTAPRTPVYELQPVSGLTQTGLDAAKLKLHVGQRIEVTVRPVDTVAPAPSSAGTTTTQAAAPAEPAPQRFSVIDLKRINGQCS